VILAVGRLAIGLFYPPVTPLEEIIGTHKQVDGRWVVPLPHPSGASRWHQIEANREKIRQAIGLIQAHAQTMGVERENQGDLQTIE
jgi:uracil-DNA glycosylase